MFLDGVLIYKVIIIGQAFSIRNVEKLDKLEYLFKKLLVSSSIDT